MQVDGLTKSFGDLVLFRKISFGVAEGQRIGLIAKNGTGKTTLLNIIAGKEGYDEGSIVFRRDLRVGYLEQDPHYPEDLTVLEACFYHGNSTVELIKEYESCMETEGNPGLEELLARMEHEKAWDYERKAKQILSQLKIRDFSQQIRHLSGGQLKRVALANVLITEPDFLILDEPTAPLSDTETAELFRLVKHLQETENIAIIFISHRIHEILQICEKYTVMRNGVIVDTSPVTKETTSREIVEKMLGRTFEEQFHKEKVQIGEKVFEVKNLCGADGKVEDVSFYVRKGEIVGIAGLVGAGKSELCKTIFGAYERTSGSVLLGGRELKINNPSQAVKNGIALVPEERRKEGVLVNENVTLNLSAAALSKFCNGSFVSKAKTEKNAHEYVEGLDIKTPSIKQHVKNLSGGNQQKVAVGKWLAADCDVYIFDEPTKGVDVGAKQDIFRLINDITLRGNSVIYASCENAELLSITDRIYVLFDGRVMAELETAKTDEDEIMHYAVGSTTKYAR